MDLPPSSPSPSSSPSTPSQTFQNLNRITSLQILKQAASSSSSNLFTFLVLSLTLFSFRKSIENGSHSITSVIDRDPALKSLFSNLDISNKYLRSIDGIPPRRRPFLQLNRIGVIEDELLLEEKRKVYGNGSFSELGFQIVEEQGRARISQIVQPGFSFKTEGLFIEEEVQEPVALDSGEMAALVFIFLSMSASYGWMVFCYVLTYSCVLGVVFVASASDVLEKENSFLKNMWEGCRLGMKKVFLFVLVKWAVRDSVTQILGLWFFGEMEDAHSFFRLFVRMKLMPLWSTSLSFPRLERVTEFVNALFIAETSMDFWISFNPWMMILDWNLPGREVVAECFFLLCSVLGKGVVVKLLECLVCGSFIRRVLGRVCGGVGASMVQCAAEVYFMVVWMMLYLSARFKEARSGGRVFGEREIENVLREVR